MASQETPTPEAKGHRVRDRLLDGLEWVRQEATKLMRIGRLKYDTTALQRERASVFQELGKRTCELIKRDQLNAEELKILVERIDSLSQRIDESRAAIEELARTRNEAKVATKQD